MIEGLTIPIMNLIMHDRFNTNGWVPPEPSNPLITKMIDMGLFERKIDIDNGFIVPTKLCLDLRTELIRENFSII